MKTVLIAGGTGYIGKNLENYLSQKGYTVKILTRKCTKENHVLWNPETQTIDATKCSDVQILINLCGEGLDKQRWTNKRQKQLIDSRINPATVLFELRNSFPQLEHYISASGITAYGFDEGKIEHKEDAPYGMDFLSQLVRKWESAADQFQSVALVTKMRIAVVCEWNQGALKKMAVPVKMGIGSPLGNGKQQIPWLHISDLTRMFEFVIANQLDGTFNTNANNNANEEITKAIAKKLNKKIWIPNVPAFVLKIVLGRMAELVLKGAKASNEKIKKAGFEFQTTEINQMLK